ncbi:MAG: L,D-transpeptidase [Thermosynechococcaceae cyanobacterium]
MFTAWLSSAKWFRAGVGLVFSILWFGLFPLLIQPSTAQMGFHVTGLPPPESQDPIAAKVTALKQSHQRWLQVILSRQRLIAWEGGNPVYAVIVSTGKPGMATPTGVFAIQTKHRLARMRGADYDVPDVPYTMYYSGNYGIHGAYWHHNFGTPVTHGCVNVAVDHAQWFFNWASIGTPIIVQH